MSERVGLVVSPERLQLPPGGRADVTLGVTNLSNLVEQFSLQVEGLDAGWFTLRVPTVSLFPASEGQLALEVQLPDGRAARAGTQRLVLRVLPSSNPQDGAAVELPLEVLPYGALGLELTPRVVTTRRTARFRALLTNRGNQEQVVDLAVSDPGEDLEAKLGADRVSVAPGASEEVELRLRPRHRPLVGLRVRYPFTVGVWPAGSDVGEPMAEQQGDLVYHPLFTSFSGLSRRARLLLLGLAGLLIAAAVAVWFFGAPRPAPPATPSAETTSVVLASTSPAETPEATITPAPSVASTSAAAVAKPAAPPPVVARFELGHPADVGRGEFELSWEVRGAGQVTIDGQPQPPAGSMRVKPPDDHVYTLQARGEGGMATRSLGVVILRPPEIRDLQAAPNPVPRGQPVTLTWEVKRAERAGLDDQAVDPAKGSAQKRPDRDTSYTLVAENELGRVERRVLVRVVEPTPKP